MYEALSFPVPNVEVRFSERLRLLLRNVKLFSDVWNYQIKLNHSGKPPMNDIDLELLPNGSVMITFVPYGKQVRECIKPGRFFRNFFVEKAYKHVEDSYIEWFTKFLHASFVPAHVEEVRGEEVAHWYSEKNYVLGNGSLQQNCMRYDKCQSYLDLQVQCPNISLLIIRGQNNPEKVSAFADIYKNVKVAGREEPQTIVDRPYFTYEYEKLVFKEYAKKSGFWFVVSGMSVCTPEGELVKMPKMSVETLLPLLPKYPYLDTFYSMDWSGTTLCTKEPVLRRKCLHSAVGEVNTYGATMTARTKSGRSRYWNLKTKKTNKRVHEAIKGGK